MLAGIPPPDFPGLHHSSCSLPFQLWGCSLGPTEADILGIKYIGINFTKEKDLYTESCKTLLKEIKEDTSKWKDIHAHGLEDVLLSCLYYLQQSTDLMQSLSKSQ